MRIALDYDNTYTADPTFWDLFIEMAKTAGHEVRMVTYRNEVFDQCRGLTVLHKRGVKIHWTRGVAKRWWMEQFGGGWIPEIWIEDKPEAILHNSSTSANDLAFWRTTEASRV